MEDEEYTAKHKAIIAQMRNREIKSEEARRRIDELTKEYIKSRRRKRRRNG